MLSGDILLFKIFLIATYSNGTLYVLPKNTCPKFPPLIEFPREYLAKRAQGGEIY